MRGSNSAVECKLPKLDVGVNGNGLVKEEVGKSFLV